MIIIIIGAEIVRIGRSQSAQDRSGYHACRDPASVATPATVAMPPAVAAPGSRGTSWNLRNANDGYCGERDHQFTQHELSHWVGRPQPSRHRGRVELSMINASASIRT